MNRYLLLSSLPLLLSLALLLSTLQSLLLSLSRARAHAHTRTSPTALLDSFADVNKFDSISIRVNIDQTDDEKTRYPCRGKQSSSYVYVAA
jgi:hypothetical protein